jgi:type III secretion system needle length determinant
MSGIGPPDAPGAPAPGAGWEPPGQAGPAPAPADPAALEADAERLQALLARREPPGEGGGGGGQEGRQDDAASQEDLPLARAEEMRGAAEALFFQLGLRAPEAPPPAEAPRGELSALVDQVADRVLVGTREDGTTELRIALKGTALDGAELRIARAEGGVQVQILAGGPALDLLAKQGAALAEGLADRLGSRVTVEVVAPPGEAGAGGQQGGGQQGREGRSRGLEALLMSWAAG